MLPAIFVSHGSPMLALEPADARDFLKKLPELLPARPKAILVISAHWLTRGSSVTAAAKPPTLHDFYGFPDALYELDAAGELSFPELYKIVS